MCLCQIGSEHGDESGITLIRAHFAAEEEAYEVLARHGKIYEDLLTRFEKMMQQFSRF